MLPPIPLFRHCDASRHHSRKERATPRGGLWRRRRSSEIHSSEETVEIFIEADFETLREGRRRFAILNIPRHLFSQATAAAARRATSPDKGLRYLCQADRSQKHDRE